MSILQRELEAERILQRAAKNMRNGWDSVRAHETALRELDRLAFGLADLRYWKSKLARITGWHK